MANQERIDSIIDTPAIKKQVAEVTTLINGIDEKIKNISVLKLRMENASGFKELGKAAKELDSIQKATVAQMQELKVKNLELSAARKQQVIETQKEKEETKKLNEAKKQTVQTAAQEKKMIDQATNEYFQLNKALQEAELKYKNLALTQGFSNKATKEALANAVSIRKVLNQVDQSLGNYQRNVGNYGSAFNGLNFSIQQILREAPSAAISLNTFFLAISNNLPMLFDEITKVKAANAAAAAEAKVSAAAAFKQAESQALAAGATAQNARAQGDLASKQILANSAQAKAVPLSRQFFQSIFSINSLLTVSALALTLFGSKMADFVSKLFMGTKAMSEFEKTQKGINAALAGAKDAYVQAKVEVSNLMIAFKQAREGIIKKEEAVKLYNETIGKTTGEVKSLDEAEQALAKNAEAYIKFTLYKAAANIALQESAKKLYEGMAVDQKKALTQEGKQIAELGEQINAAYGTAKYFPLLDQRRVLQQTFGNFNPELEKEGKEIEKEGKRQLDIANYFLQQAEIMSKAFKFDFNGIKDPTKTTKDKKDKKGTDLADDTAQRILQSQYEINRTKLENEAETNRQLLESDKTYHSDKLAALREFGAQQAALIELEKQYQIASEELSYQERKENLKKQKKEEGANIQEINKQEIKETEAHNKKLEEIEVKSAQKLIQLGYNQVKEEKKILDKKEQDRQDSLKQFQQVLDDQQAIIDNYYSKVRSQDEKEKQDAEERTKRMAEATKAIYQNLYKNLQDLFFSFIASGIEREQQALEEKQRLLDEETAKRINQINLIGYTEAERNRQIAIVQKNAMAQTEQIEKRKRALAVQRAKFEKASAITTIILDTSIAIIRALGDKTVAYPIRAAYAAATGVVGAISLAKALMAPLPKYRHGKDAADNYEGLAIVGDGGQREPILREDGTLELSPARDTVTYLGRNDIVYPSVQEMMNAMVIKQIRDLPTMIMPKNNHDAQMRKLMTTQTNLLKQISQKPANSYHISSDVRIKQLTDHYFKW